MNIHESAMDNMNRLATDIIECPSCGSEEMEFTSLNMDEEILEMTEVWKCSECGVKQVITIEG